MWRDTLKMINQHHNFLLTTHVNPDGDGIGAACALAEFLICKGKFVRFVSDSSIPRKFAFLDYHSLNEIYHENRDYKEFEVLIVLDTHKRERIGRVSQLTDLAHVTTIYIDHHEVTSSFSEHSVIDSNACSVGAMIYALYKAGNIPLNFRAAMGIYTSIICDTGRFCYSSTKPIAHKIAEECISLGVDPDLMYARLFQHVTLAETKILAHALQEMETHLNNKVVIQQLRKSDCDQFGGDEKDIEHIDLEYLHDFNNLIEDVECFVLLREVSENYVRVSLRSKSDLDITPIVRSLGGGGHPHAAGLTWRGSLKEVKQKIIDLLRELLTKQKASTI